MREAAEAAKVVRTAKAKLATEIEARILAWQSEHGLVVRSVHVETVNVGSVDNPEARVLDRVNVELAL